MSKEPHVNITYTPDGDTIATDGSVFNNGDVAWMMAAGALVMIMTPGVGFLYSGLLRRKNALSMLFLGIAGYALITFEWFFWGYSLAFSPTGSKFIGDLRHFAMINTADAPSPGSTRLPSEVFAFYQSMFAAITPVIAVAGMAERGRLGPTLVFLFCWATIVYNPVACWTWAANGWGFQLGSLDFAGGGPVHMTSGTAALAYSIWCGKRRGYGTHRLAYKPHSVSHVILGTTFLWFGWFGFNGASALSATLRAVNACVVTNIAAATGGLAWCIMDYRLERKWSAVGLCSGILAGLVGITPASGYVGPPASVAIGVSAGVVCNLATKLKFLISVDDAIDGFAIHGIGGFTGSVLTGIFAEAQYIAFDGTSLPGGWLNRNFVQLGYQLATATATIAYTFVVSSILLIAIDKVPGLSLRMSEEGEILGTDEDQMAEWAYDFAHIDRDVDSHVRDELNELGSKSPASSSIDEKAKGGAHPRDPHNPAAVHEGGADS